MPLKKVFLYDAVNDPLQVRGIHIELHDAVNSTFIDKDTSRDLNPQANGLPSNTWGVTLNFPSGKTPVDVLVLDPTYRYPGNALLYLNGDLSDEVYMDLMQLPSGPGGGRPSGASTPPSLGTDSAPAIDDSSPAGVNAWINANPGWSRLEKQAVRSLIFNYARITGSVDGDPRQHPTLSAIVQNWETASQRIGVPKELVSVAVAKAKAQTAATAW